MVICDWLDVTYSPDDVPEPELRTLLLGLGFLVEYDKGMQLMYRPPDGARGSVRVTYARRYGKISLSGGAIDYLRAADAWHEVLFHLSSSPHKVTRLDAALDVRTDAADVIARLMLRYPGGKVSLGRKALDVTRMLEVRADGRESGTYYVGYRSHARATARVYDKRLEVLKRTGVDLGHELTRYEVTARKDYGATLHDAAEPEALFWHVAAPALIPRVPEGVAMWSADNDFTGWEFTPKAYVPAEVLERRVEYSAELEALKLLSDELGAHGRSFLLSLISAKLGASTIADEEAA